MEMENKYASKGVGGTALGIGIGALGLELLRGNGGLTNILGGGCSCADHGVTRYDAEKDARIAALETEIKLRDANTFTMGELEKFRNYVDNKFAHVESQLCAQSVVNAQITANLSCLQNTVNVLSGLTKTVIPIDSICPTPAVATPTTGG